MLKPEIIQDIQKVAKRIGLVPGKDTFSFLEYNQNGGKFNQYAISDGGTTWGQYCATSGFGSKAIIPVSDKEYFEKLKKAVAILGRTPKQSELKQFGLLSTKKRWHNFSAFLEDAASKGIITLPGSAATAKTDQTENILEKPQAIKSAQETSARAVPPIPIKTKRKNWARTGIDGFHYAPQDESGVIALFAIFCAQGTIPWQILDLNGGQGIDAVCWDEKNQKEIRVELKHTLSKTSWNHSFDSFDYLVCWEKRWTDFPKPVIELKTYVRS